MPIVQTSSIVLPTVWTVGTETETVADILEHTSIEFPVEMLQEKEIHISAIEAVAAGVPGPLWAWIELSPYQTPTSAAYWAAIGGGGGAIAPAAPHIEIGTGVNLAVHGIVLAWTMHSTFARVVIQTPVLVATAAWTVQVILSAKTP